MPDLLIPYEHPRWFEPLWAALDRRGIDYKAVRLGPHAFDPADATPPARLVLSRLAMSAASREAEHPIFYARSLFAHWEAAGVRVLNGTRTLAYDTSKALQLAAIARLGLRVPRTRVVHRAMDVPAAAEQVGFPLLVKANIGGAGAGIVRFDDADALRAAATDGTLPTSIDNVLLVQEFIPARDGVVTRMEMLGGDVLYALSVHSDGGFDLCPADACVAERPAVRMAATQPAPELQHAAVRIIAACGMDLGGVECVHDERTGEPVFFDVNGLSNYVANPLDVLGWDPHERLVDWLVGQPEMQA